MLDAYFHPFDATMRHDVASVTKSITSTLFGRAIDTLTFSPDRRSVNVVAIERTGLNREQFRGRASP